MPCYFKIMILETPDNLYLPEQLHNIIKVYPGIPVKIKRTHRHICRNPLHLVEHEHDIVEILASVGIQVFVEAVAVGSVHIFRENEHECPEILPPREESLRQNSGLVKSRFSE